MLYLWLVNEGIYSGFFKDNFIPFLSDGKGYFIEGGLFNTNQKSGKQRTVV